MIQPRQFEGDLLGFGPKAQVVSCLGRHAVMGDGSTYTDCGEDILKLVDKGNQPWVIDVDPVMGCESTVAMRCTGGCLLCTYALAFVAAISGGQQ